MEREELSDWLRLQLTPGVGNLAARRLLAEFGLPAHIFSQSLASLGWIVGPAQAQALLTVPDNLAAQLQKTWRWLQEEPVLRRVVPLGDACYPQPLLHTEDPPLLLYGMGFAQAWGEQGFSAALHTSLAIVGSRNPTPQGLANAHDFAADLAQKGITVVSGMALGVDGAAHAGALDGAAAQPSGDQVVTIAVVGTGLDRVYPRQHLELAHRIAQRGLILSEFPLGTGPLAAHFPMRNRIISGLTRGTLVVEAALKSGSLITARCAAEQGREVFAIPGSIHATQSRGCHVLIKQGAKLVECAQDIVEELDWDAALLEKALAGASTGKKPGGDAGWGEVNAGEDWQPKAAGRKQPDQTARPINVPDDLPDSPLLQALGYEARGLDALQARTGLPTPDLQAQLMALEMDGHVARLPGGLFQRVVRA